MREYVGDKWIHNGSYHRRAGKETFKRACIISKKAFSLNRLNLLNT